MKFLIVVASLVLVAGASSIYEDWQQFKLDHGKTYRSLVEEKRRYLIFRDNVRQIQEHNDKYERGEESFAKKVTQFTDMTDEEFLDLLKLQGVPARPRNALSFDATGIQEKDAVDWRKKGAVTPVKNQLHCGSCWAFSAVGSLEGQFFQKNGTLVSFSVQELLDCAAENYGNHGCHGGLMDQAFDFMQDEGIQTEEQYPYEAKRSQCHGIGKYVTKVDSYVDLLNEEEMAKAVSAKGPVSVAIDASDIRDYSHGIIDEKCACGNRKHDLNHGVLVVGYGSEDGVNYWIVKNSWGEKWGHNGYFKLKKGKQLDHGKTYRSLVEEKRRYLIFRDNVRQIQEHNEKYERGEQSFAKKVTQFTDMTHEEFLDLLKLQGVPARPSNALSFDATGIQEEDAVDWREKGAVTPVKDQLHCGSCWAFSAVGSLEGQFFQKNGTLVSFSAQELVDCAAEEYGNAGCEGGMMDQAFDFMKDEGIQTDEQYPYKAEMLDCKGIGKYETKINSYVDLLNEEELAKAVSAKGPVSVAIDASDIRDYHHGIIDEKCDCGKGKGDLNHGVLVVGYGSEGGVDYWIVKNSWGKKWGDNGYFKLKRGNQVCGIGLYNTYPVL
nr:unnamed protein product [Callosobruchus chinensis]